MSIQGISGHHKGIQRALPAGSFPEGLELGCVRKDFFRPLLDVRALSAYRRKVYPLRGRH
jgi:hypothetical protein